MAFFYLLRFWVAYFNLQYPHPPRNLPCSYQLIQAFLFSEVLHQDSQDRNQKLNH